jgi:Transmembrane amino acid transporter protein
LLFKDAEKAEKQSFKSVLITNLGILIVPFTIAIFYPDVGKLAGCLGSLCALGCIYVLPTITNLKASYLEIKHPVLAEALKQNKFEYTQSRNPLNSPKLKLQSRFVA